LGSIVAGFLGARLLYVLTNVKDFHSVGEAFAFQAGGLTFYGAFGAGVFGSYWVLRKRDLSWLAFADAAAPGLALSSTIGRIGCYLAGCDYGTPLRPHAPHWLERLGTFPKWPDEVAGAAAGSPAWVDHVLNHGLSLSTKASLPVHPVELYEAAASLAVFAGLIASRRARRFRGQTFIALVLAYGATRLFLETVRGDPERGILGPLSLSQWIALASFAAIALGLRHLSRSRHTALPG
jgi:phosphatidylglycerol:prolipoprotein diacylglycerol transferase